MRVVATNQLSAHLCQRVIVVCRLHGLALALGKIDAIHREVDEHAERHHLERFAVVNERERLLKVALLEVELRGDEAHGRVLTGGLVLQKFLQRTKDCLLGIFASGGRLLVLGEKLDDLQSGMRKEKDREAREIRPQLSEKSN